MTIVQATKGEAQDSMTTTTHWVMCSRCGAMIRFDDDAHQCYPHLGYHDTDGFYEDDEETDQRTENPQSGVQGDYWRCPFCHREIAAGTAHVCENAGKWDATDGTWWYDDGEKAAYEVAMNPNVHTVTASCFWRCYTCGQDVRLGEPQHTCVPTGEGTAR